MPRQSRGRSAPAPRTAPAPAPAARAAPPAQARSPTTPAHAPQSPTNMVPHQQPSQGPGMMGQIAANAASVAIGSTLARGLSSALGWGGSSAPAEGQASAAAPPVDYNNQAYGAASQQAPQQGVSACEPIAKDFAKCLSATNNDVTPCQYYLDQFRACQAAAAPY